MACQPTNVEELFLAAAELSSPRERATYLDAHCTGDPEARRRVEALLRAHDAGGAFLDQPPPMLVLRADETALGSADQTGGALPQHPDAFALGLLGLMSPNGRLERLGAYEIAEVIGYGGMGIVLLARDPRLDRTVALKVMSPACAADPSARQRFLDEARAAAAVRHDHVVTIHAIEEVGGLPYLVMEYVEGGSLEQRLRQAGPMPAEQVVEIGRQAALGLAAAHAQGLVHRDIKPANILLEGGRVVSGGVVSRAKEDQARPLTTHHAPLTRVKISDFGLARAVDAAAVTQSGAVAGTPQYMAPEQARGERADQRSDLFSLGCVLYALCTGRPPFAAASPLAALRRVCEETPPAVTQLNPAIPRWLEQIIDRLMEKDPQRRFASAAEVAELLARPAEQWEQKLTRGPWGTRSRRRALAFALIPALAAVALWIVWERHPESSDRAQHNETTPDQKRAADGEQAPLEPVSPLFGEIRQIVVGSDLNALAVAPDGRTAYVGGRSPTLSAWDLETGKPIREFRGHDNPVGDLALSPDGTRLASCAGDRTVRIWDTQSGAELVQLRFKVTVRRLEFSPNGGSILACFYGGKVAEAMTRKNPGLDIDYRGVAVLDAATGKQIKSFAGPRPCWFYSAAWSGAGNRVAAGTEDGSILVFDAETAKLLWERQGTQETPPKSRGLRGPIHALRFSRDGTRLFSSDNSNSFLCWNAADGTLRSQRFFSSGLTDFALSFDETWMAANGTPEIRLCDLTGRLGDRGLISLPGHTGMVRGVAFVPGQEYAVSCAWDGTIRMWKLPRRPALPG